MNIALFWRVWQDCYRQARRADDDVLLSAFTATLVALSTSSKLK